MSCATTRLFRRGEYPSNPFVQRRLVGDYRSVEREEHVRYVVVLLVLCLVVPASAEMKTRTFENTREGYVVTVPRDWDRDTSFRLGTIFLSRDGLANVEIRIDELREGETLEEYVARAESLRTLVDETNPAERVLSETDRERYNCDEGMLGTYNVGSAEVQTLMVRAYLLKDRRIYMQTILVMANKLNEYREALDLITGSFRITAE
jgi:hypothetical protein